MKLRRIRAVFKKQIMNMSQNGGILMQFFLYPVITGVMVLVQPVDAVFAKVSLVMTMATIFTGMMPIMTVNSIISEDKWGNSLRMLIMSTVKPPEYLIGITAYILFVSLVSSLVFGLIGGFGGFALLLFVGIIMSGIITTLILGSAMAIQGARKAGTGTLITIVSLLNGILPVLGMSNQAIANISKFWYTQQIRELMGDLYGNYFGNLWYRFIIIGANFVVFLILFMISYKSNRFYGEK